MKNLRARQKSEDALIKQLVPIICPSEGHPSQDFGRPNVPVREFSCRSRQRTGVLLTREFEFAGEEEYELEKLEQI